MCKEGLEARVETKDQLTPFLNGKGETVEGRGVCYGKRFYNILCLT